MELADRFWAKVSKTTECWLWTASKDFHGYGLFKINYRYRRAHRVAWELAHGNIPEGLQIDHLCRVRACVRPDHLEPVTQAENIHRGEAGLKTGAKQRAKTECWRGHPFDEQNTGWVGGKRPHRVCRKCARISDTKNQVRKRNYNREWMRKYRATLNSP